MTQEELKNWKALLFSKDKENVELALQMYDSGIIDFDLEYKLKRLFSFIEWHLSGKVQELKAALQRLTTVWRPFSNWFNVMGSSLPVLLNDLKVETLVVSKPEFLDIEYITKFPDLKKLIIEDISPYYFTDSFYRMISMLEVDEVVFDYYSRGIQANSMNVLGSFMKVISEMILKISNVKCKKFIIQGPFYIQSYFKCVKDDSQLQKICLVRQKSEENFATIEWKGPVLYSKKDTLKYVRK